MKALVLYRPNSEHERAVIELVRDYNKQTSFELEMLSLDTIDGSSKAEIYDIVQYPAILVTDDNGQLIKMWQGTPLPLINEIAGAQRL